VKTLTEFADFAARYKKAVTAGLTGAIMALIAGASEGGLSTQEWLIALLALLTVGGPTAYVANKKPGASGA
jgi:hypothetical protein